MKQNGSALRCAIYARISTADQSLENQLAQLRDFAVGSGWDIVHVFTDEASAKTGDRPGFKSMMEHASRRHFDVLLFWALDRLTREGLPSSAGIHRTGELTACGSLQRGDRSGTPSPKKLGGITTLAALVRCLSEQICCVPICT